MIKHVKVVKKSIKNDYTPQMYDYGKAKQEKRKLFNIFQNTIPYISFDKFQIKVKGGLNMCLLKEIKLDSFTSVKNEIDKMEKFNIIDTSEIIIYYKENKHKYLSYKLGLNKELTKLDQSIFVHLTNFFLQYENNTSKTDTTEYDFSILNKLIKSNLDFSKYNGKTYDCILYNNNFILQYTLYYKNPTKSHRITLGYLLNLNKANFIFLISKINPSTLKMDYNNLELMFILNDKYFSIIMYGKDCLNNYNLFIFIKIFISFFQISIKLNEKENDVKFSQMIISIKINSTLINFIIKNKSDGSFGMCVEIIFNVCISSQQIINNMKEIKYIDGKSFNFNKLKQVKQRGTK